MSHTDPHRDRSFGLSIGSILLAAAVLFAVRGRLGRAEVLAAIGAVLMISGALKPAFLKWPSEMWWRLARALAYVNARVLLTILFGIAIVPAGVVWRLTGRDPLARRREKSTGWSPHPARYRDPQHYNRMF